MITFAVCSLVAGRVAERARKQKEQAEQRREDVERLYVLSQEMMLHEDSAGLIRALPALVARIFSLESVVLYVQDRDQYVSTVAGVGRAFQSKSARGDQRGACDNRTAGWF